MTKRLRAACGAALLALLASGGIARGQERVFAVERLLPGDAAGGVRLEAALLFADLREHRENALAERDRLRLTPAGASFLDPASLKRDFGFDWIEELGRVADLAAPKGKPLPAAAALFSGADGYGFQVVLDAAPGFTGRLEQALRAGTAPAVFRSVANGLLRGEVHGRAFVGREEEGGAVRFAPREEMLAAASGGASLFSGAMAARVRGCSEVLFVPGGGKLAGRLAETAGKGAVAAFVAGARGLALGLSRDGAGSTEARLVLDHPMLEQLAPLLAPPDAANPFFELWGEQATALYTLRLPPALLAPGLFALADGIGKAKHAPPPALLEALQSLDGHLGVARFGSPGDWAVGLHFADEQAPAAMLPALREWLDAIGEADQIALLRSFVEERIPGTAAATLSLGAEGGSARIGATNVGRALVITPQPARRNALLAPPAKKGAGARSPLTAPMRAALAKPALLSVYQVLGDELSFLGGTGWFALVMREGYRSGVRTSGVQSRLVDTVMERLPAIAALASARFDLSYDSLLRAEVDGGCAVVQALGSDLPAKGRYFDAVNRRLAGDPAGYYDGLIAVAAGKDAAGREGRRARAALLYNPFSGITTLGVLAAVAVPNFMSFREKAKRAAGKEPSGAPPDESIEDQFPDEDGGGDDDGIEDDDGGAIPDEGEDDGVAPPTEERL